MAFALSPSLSKLGYKYKLKLLIRNFFLTLNIAFNHFMLALPFVSNVYKIFLFALSKTLWASFLLNMIGWILNWQDDSRTVASTLFPSLGPLLKRKKDHGNHTPLFLLSYNISSIDQNCHWLCYGLITGTLIKPQAMHCFRACIMELFSYKKGRSSLPIEECYMIANKLQQYGRWFPICLVWCIWRKRNL